MGLFDFVKNAGASLFGNKEKEAAKAKLEAEQKLAHDNAIMERLAEDHVAKMGLEVEGLDITIENGIARIAGIAKDQATREKTILTVGNVNGIGQVSDEMVVNTPEEAPEVSVAPRFYTVVSGDSLSKIAKREYGNAMKYNEIFEANKPMLKDVDKIYPGQVLRIPPLD